jgi:hypothetical protein
MDLRALAGLGREATDEELAAEEADGDDAIALAHDTWSQISRAGEQAELLSVVNAEGLAGAAKWLDGRGLAWAWVSPHSHKGPRQRSPQTSRQARAVLGSPPPRPF